MVFITYFYAQKILLSKMLKNRRGKERKTNSKLVSHKLNICTFVCPAPWNLCKAAWLSYATQLSVPVIEF